MQFAAVPPGTLPAAAFGIRGPDHDIEVPNGAPFSIALGNALSSRPATIPGSRAIPYSSVAGALAGYLFTTDTTLLARAVQTYVPDPAKLQAAR